MKALLLNTSDIKGGAARAAYRLHQGLNQISVKSQMLSQLKYSQDPNVFGTNLASGIGQVKTGLRLTLDQIPLKLYNQRGKQRFSANWLPYQITTQVAQLDPDIINLHWIGAGYLQIESIAKFNKPIVWTFHDMWAFTGGCHYDQECQKYTNSCGGCPQLGSDKNWDLSSWVWQRKQKAWQNLNLTIVTPSKWLANCAKASSLFKNKRIEVIPYGLNLNIFRPINQKIARQLLKLPQDKQLVLFLSLKATSDQRKGFHLLQPALQKLSALGSNDCMELIVVGASKPEKAVDFGFKSHYLGTLTDDLMLALAYSAADAFIAPSIQDNLPNTVLEAISCGTPCIAFNIGGMPDMIEHQQNGYLVKPYEIDDLVQGITWTLKNKERNQKLAYRAREKAEQEFALEIQAHRYNSLFTEILEGSNNQKRQNFSEQQQNSFREIAQLSESI
ncbi:glycosyltransferase family 4 protein [Pleurocapsa sp. PCC 7319]|uniref:glycosyltransferase family 4 protein n=1 Tax=Pleurocapsa sp. PCC 7319 TaxID=118161 RepID=UPI000349B699|nr:glycosyltransferase family 4 protein [Pleurocapsa sp. PCC 7319]